MEVISSSIELIAVNDSLAEFKCRRKLSGFIQLPEKDGVTVIIEGGYILGTFDCTVCAIKEIALLAARIEEADKKYGISYQKLKECYGLAASVSFFTH